MPYHDENDDQGLGILRFTSSCHEPIVIAQDESHVTVYHVRQHINPASVCIHEFGLK